MNFVSATCPHCGKELQVPQDAEQIVCMYCAQPIQIKSLLSRQEQDRGELYSTLIGQAVSLLDSRLFRITGELHGMKQAGYDKNFEEYHALFQPSLRAYSLAATESDDAAAYFSQVLLDRFLKQFEESGIKKESDNRFFDYRYMIVAFTIPAILELHTPSVDLLADSFLERWNTRYPKNRLGKADYDSIRNGFRHKLCFITTAVCTSLGKGDDCRELNAFRAFRDGWFAQTPGGQLKINEYYLFAPMIVREIDRSEDRQAIYRSIWDSYLSPCLSYIEKENYAECALLYEQMVTSLEQKWIH